MVFCNGLHLFQRNISLMIDEDFYYQWVLGQILQMYLVIILFSMLAVVSSLRSMSSIAMSGWWGLVPDLVSLLLGRS